MFLITTTAKIRFQSLHLKLSKVKELVLILPYSMKIKNGQFLLLVRTYTIVGNLMKLPFYVEVCAFVGKLTRLAVTLQLVIKNQNHILSPTLAAYLPA